MILNNIKHIFKLSLFCIFIYSYTLTAHSAPDFCNIANVGDCDIGLRCDETYSINSHCFPFDATLNKEGICTCPDGGCDGCGVDGTIPAEYCAYPKNIMNMIYPINGSALINIDMQTKLSYEEEGYPNSCGNNKKTDFSCADYTAIYPPLAGTACIPGVMAERSDGFTKTKTHKNLIFGRFNKASEDKTGKYKLTKFTKTDGIALDPNKYYGIQPRIETVTIAGETTNIIRTYFTQGDKHDNLQLIKNLSSTNGSNSPFSGGSYFIFEDKNFSNVKNDTIVDGYRWRPMEHCGCINNCDPATYQLTDKNNPDHNEGVDCYNTPYFAGLLINRNDSSEGIRIPPSEPKRHFPDMRFKVKANNIDYKPPPIISWSLATESTFLEPVITVTITDSDGSNNSTSIAIDRTNTNYTKNYNIYTYQFLMTIENSSLLHNKPEICLYKCNYNNTLSACYVNGIEERTGAKNILSYITTGTNSQIEEAKDYLLVPYNNSSDCAEYPQINSVKVMGRAINSTYNEPKIKIELNDGTNSSSSIFNLSKKTKIEKYLSNSLDGNETTIKNTSGNSIFYPLALNIIQEKTLELTDSKYNFCRYYYPSLSASGISFDDECEKHQEISDKHDTHICLHNFFPEPYISSNVNVRTIPYYVDMDEIENLYQAEYDSSYKRNLCVPAPVRINSFRYETTATDPITNKIYVNYNEPKPFNDYADGYVADGAEIDELIIEELIAPDMVGSTENIYELDYYHKIKIIGDNNGSQYCIKASIYDYENGFWGPASQIGSCFITSSCPDRTTESYSLPASEYTGYDSTVAGTCNTKYSGTVTAYCLEGGNWQINNNCTLNQCAKKAAVQGYGMKKLTTMDVKNNCTATYENEHYNVIIDFDPATPGTVVEKNCADTGLPFTGTVTGTCNDDGNWSFAFSCKRQCWSLRHSMYLPVDRLSDIAKRSKSCGVRNRKEDLTTCRGYCDGRNGKWDVAKKYWGCVDPGSIILK